jgi:putative endonuclease
VTRVGHDRRACPRSCHSELVEESLPFHHPDVRDYFVYILGSKSGVLYVGVTNDLTRRLFEHKQKLIEGFTNKYNVSRLLYFETFENITDAITREKQIKGWRRSKKAALIESTNPTWLDLGAEWTNDRDPSTGSG